MDVYEAGLRALERYGFGIVLCSFVLWFARVDIILPMVKSHQEFLHEMALTQREISSTIRDQTRLLHEILRSRDRNDIAGSPDVKPSAN